MYCNFHTWSNHKLGNIPPKNGACHLANLLKKLNKLSLKSVGRPWGFLWLLLSSSVGGTSKKITFNKKNGPSKLSSPWVCPYIFFKWPDLTLYHFYHLLTLIIEDGSFPIPNTTRLINPGHQIQRLRHSSAQLVRPLARQHGILDPAPLGHWQVEPRLGNRGTNTMRMSGQEYSQQRLLDDSCIKKQLVLSNHIWLEVPFHSRMFYRCSQNMHTSIYFQLMDFARSWALRTCKSPRHSTFLPISCHTRI